MILELSKRQLAHLFQKHGLPLASCDKIAAALQEAFNIGHNSDVMVVKHKPPKEK